LGKPKVANAVGWSDALFRVTVAANNQIHDLLYRVRKAQGRPAFAQFHAAAMPCRGM
jgi:hypothetical protein